MPITVCYSAITTKGVAMPTLKYILIAFAIGSLVGCAGDESGGANTSEQPQSTDLTYANVNARVITPRCLPCHSDAGGNPDGKNFETYSNVLMHKSEMRFQVAQGNMPPPPNSPLSDEERNLLIDWIDAGAPE
jgi:uncharacterized membrane protein